MPYGKKRVPRVSARLHGGRRDISLLVYLLILLFPPAYMIVRKGIVSAFHFFAPDAYYYLSVAKHSRFGFYTFDGVNPTNGFHPLWQYVLTDVSWIVGPDSEVFIWATFVLVILATCIGYVFLALALRHVTKSSFAILWLVPGVYYFMSIFIDAKFGAPWSFMNGMESSLSILFAGTLLYMLVRDEVHRRPWLVGLLLALIVLARLDDGLLVATLIIVMVISNPMRTDPYIKSFWIGLPVALGLGLYLLFNYYAVGEAFPVSGTLKLSRAYSWNLGNLFSVLNGEEKWWRALGTRHGQIWIPAFFAFIFFTYFAFNKNRNRNYNIIVHPCLFGVALYVISKAILLFYYMNIWHQGTWYFAVSIMFANFLMVVLGFAVFRRWFGSSENVLMKQVKYLAPVILAGLMSTEFLAAREHYRYSYYLFWSDRQVIQKELEQIDPDMKIIEVDDGILSFSLDFPMMSGLGFLLHPEAVEPFQKGRILTYAAEQGYSVVASLNYTTRNHGRLVSSKEDAANYTFETVYTHPASGAVFKTFRLRESD